VLLKKGENLYGYCYECIQDGRPVLVRVYAKGTSETKADVSAEKKITDKCKRYGMTEPKLKKRAWLE
jgi:hypothetical protein